MAALPAQSHVQPWTVDEWIALNEASPDGSRYELVDGSVLMSPPPSMRHQFAGDQLRMFLHAAAPPDFIAVTASGIPMGNQTGLIPDVLVVDRSALAGGIKMPDPSQVHLVVEIVSPSTTTTDRTLKPAKYAAAGILHFWRLETARFRGLGLDRLPVLFTYTLDAEGEYQLTRRLAAGTTTRIEESFPVELDPADLVA
ncbi:Uma2 family endonuclease [Embleya sp. NPDC127516]|uniref:Uma2 family endonuclease n=2 Tax=unclassified Embleya TaxID=2699296 RepID=UPI0038172171